MQSLYRNAFIAVLLAANGFILLNGQNLEDGKQLIQQGKFSEAKKVLLQVVDKDDKNAEAHYQLGLALFSRANPERNIDDAVDEIEKATDLNPNNADYQFLYGAAIGEKAQKSGMIKQAFLAPKIKKAFTRAVELNPNHVQARIGLAQYYLMAPSIMGGDEAEGWKQLDEAIKIDEVQGRFMKANMLTRQKKMEEAEKEYKILVSSKPNEWRTWKGYGYFCLRNERTDEAIQHFRKYVGLRSDTADSFQSLAEAFIKKNDYDKAIENLNKSLTLDKTYVPALLSFGDVYKAKGQKKEAKEKYEAAVSFAQNDYYKKQAEKKLKEVE
jgi:Tfp pilus assembly protein PilF